MAAITWTNITDHNPAASTVDVDVQATILDFVNINTEVELLGGEDSARVKLARIYLANHLISPELHQTNPLASGPVTSEKEGELAVTYGQSMSKSALARTSWGQLYLDIIKNSACRVPRVF